MGTGCWPTFWFQSTPAIAGGRIPTPASDLPAGPCFNPRPPLLAGESPHNVHAFKRLDGFNPRPPLLAGESVLLVEHVADVAVSIHARHCWRANHLFVVRVVPAVFLFQSTPAIAGGRIDLRVAPFPMDTSFQSTPAIAGGRISLLCGLCQRSSCFNPRPPLLAGESFPYVPFWGFREVSIHARHCWRANRGLGAH